MSVRIEIETTARVHAAGQETQETHQDYRTVLDAGDEPLRGALVQAGWIPPGQVSTARSPFTLEWERIGPHHWRARGLYGGTYFVRKDRWMRADVRFNRNVGPHALRGGKTVDQCKTSAEVHHARLMMDAVTELVIAGRIVAFEDQGRDALKRMDKATEAFAATVPWEDQPEEASAE